MANGPDFRFQGGTFPIAGIAQALARKAEVEEQGRQARVQERQQRLSSFLNILSTGANLARVGQQFSAGQQALAAGKRAAQAAPQLAQSLSQSTPGALPAGVAGPETSGVAAVRQAALVDPQSAAKAVLSRDALTEDLPSNPKELITRKFARGEITEEDFFAQLKRLPGQRVTIEKGLPAESAGKLAAIDLSIKDIASVENIIFNKDGTVDRGAIFSANVPGGGVPFSSGRKINAEITNAVATKLRLETGAAAPVEEVKEIAKRFKPSLLDNDATIKSKVARLKEFMKNARFIIDPSGRFRQTNIAETGSNDDISTLSDEELIGIIRGQK